MTDCATHPSRLDTASSDDVTSLSSTQQTWPVPPTDDLIAHFRDTAGISAIHPACLALPPNSQEEFDRLVAAIDQHGQIDPVKIDQEGNVVDGRHRLAACRVLEIDPEVVTTEVDPWAIAVSNITRRQLSVGQRAAFAAKWLPEEEKRAKQRRNASLKKGKENPVPQKKAEREGEAKKIVASRVGVSGESIRKYLKLSAEFQQQVASGEKNVDAAYKECFPRPSEPAKEDSSERSSGDKSTTDKPPVTDHEDDAVAPDDSNVPHGHVPQDADDKSLRTSKASGMVSEYAPDIPDGVTVAYDSETLVVLYHASTSVHAMVFGPVDSRFMYHLEIVKICLPFNCGKKAIEVAANALVNRTIDVSD